MQKYLKYMLKWKESKKKYEMKQNFYFCLCTRAHDIFIHVCLIKLHVLFAIKFRYVKWVNWNKRKQKKKPNRTSYLYFIYSNIFFVVVIWFFFSIRSHPFLVIHRIQLNWKYVITSYVSNWKFFFFFWMDRYALHLGTVYFLSLFNHTENTLKYYCTKKRSKLCKFSLFLSISLHILLIVCVVCVHKII